MQIGYTKKIVSLFLCAVIIFSTWIIASAEDPLPESEHNYADNFTKIWSCSFGDAPYGVIVSFSEDTYFEPYNMIGNKTGDYITIYTASEKYVGTFTGNDLAGKDLYVPDSTFTLSLHSDDSINGYGFKVTALRAANLDELYSVVCHPCLESEEDVTVYFSKNAINNTVYSAFSLKFPVYHRDGYYLAGWAKAPGGNVYLSPWENLGEDVGELWAVWIKLSLCQNEIFKFDNSSSPFSEGGIRNYYLKTEDYFMIQRNLYKIFGIAPFAALIISAVYATFPAWKWRGSCYGISTVTALQHLNMIDILPIQNASSLYDMEPDKELISLINYYQAQVPESWPTEYKAFIPGTALYKAQMKKLYQSAESGNLILFSYDAGSPKRLFPTHSVLITGAYTNTKGEHILLVYDNNYPFVYHASETIYTAFVIDDDWSGLHEMIDPNNAIGAIQWTDNFSQFQSLDINGKGSALTWYQSFFRHMVNVFDLLRGIIIG